MNVLEKFKLGGKVALVTGAGKNLGRAIAFSLAEAGATVVVTSRTLSEIQQTEQAIKDEGGKALSFTMDVSNLSQVEEVVQKTVSELGRIDILVNNAAIRIPKPVVEVSEEEWRSVIDISLTGAFFCCKAVGPYMIRQRSGRIINISSRVGFQGMPNLVAYCVSKGGLIQLTRALALEWAPYNILVNSVAPGLLNTPPAFRAIQEGKTAEIPLKRAGEPEEIGSLVVYLASDACTYMTGEVVVVDGGWAVK